jgi:hypothetical protein
MNKVDCEIVCMEAMAMADGYTSDLSPDQIEAHLADCADCRGEVAQFRALSSLLATQERLERTEDVWNRIERRLPDASSIESTSHVSYPFMLLGLILLGYRLVEMIPDRHFGLLFKLVPVICVVAGFSYLRENPFTINSELRLSGE